MSDERRRAPRYAIWFPMQLEASGDVILGISRDVSAVGVLVVTAAAPTEGATVKVTMTLPGDGEGTREIEGTIVRVADNEADGEGIWRHKAAVAFEEHVEGFESLLEEVSRTSQPPPAP